MRRIIVYTVLVLSLFLFGCLNTNQKQDQPLNCLDYCQNQPHIQCVGQWRVSGDYPQCSCNYDCAIANASNQTEPERTNNVTQNNTVIQNTTNTSQTQVPPTPVPEIIRRSVNQTILSHQEKIRSDFYSRGIDGRFQEQKNTWTYVVETNAPNEITIAPASMPKIRRNGYLLNGTRVFSSIEYTELDTDTLYEYGLMILQTNQSGINSNLDQNDVFDIQFGNNRLNGCNVYFSEEFVENGIRYSAYDMTCQTLRRG